MTDLQGADHGAILQLFVKLGIPPNPIRAVRLRGRMVRELERTMRAGRQPGETDSRFRERLAKRENWYLGRIRQSLFDAREYSDWHPSPEDWIQLSVALAARLGEPGFTYAFPLSNAKRESTFIQDSLVDGLLYPDGPHFSHDPALDRARRGPIKTVAEAAREAAKIIERERQVGGRYHSEGGKAIFPKGVTAKSIESGYSSRLEARRTGIPEAVRLPPSAMGWIDADAHFRSLVHAALTFTRWPEQRFFSSDALDAVIATVSMEHAMGPPNR